MTLQITTRAEERRNKTRMYNPMKLSQLQQLTDGVASSQPPSNARINWTSYLDGIYSTVNISIAQEEPVIVVELDYLTNFVRLVDRTPPRVLGNYETFLMHIFIFWVCVFLQTNSSDLSGQPII